VSWSITDLWNWLQGVTTQISNFFSQLWTQAQNIVNTGQGIFLGLSQIGSSIWDALRWVGAQIYNAFAELIKIGEYVYNALRNFGEWIWKTFSNIPNAIYSGLQWIYNGLLWAGKQIMKALERIYNWLVDFWNNIVDNVSSWYEGWRSAVNAWWTNIWLVFRQKLKRAITANIAIPLIWKSAESIKDKGIIKGGATFFASLFIAPIAGYASAEIIDALIPTPSTANFELLPPLSMPKMTPPQLVIPEVEEKPAPEKVPIPSIGYGLPYDIPLTLPPITLSYTKPLPPVLYSLTLPQIDIYSVTVRRTNLQVSMPKVSYEYTIISPLYVEIMRRLPLLTPSVVPTSAPRPPQALGLPSVTVEVRVTGKEFKAPLPSVSIEYEHELPIMAVPTITLPSISVEAKITKIPLNISLSLPAVGASAYTGTLLYYEPWSA